MPDTFTPKARSEIMRRVKSRDTTPEKLVRSSLHSIGYRFRLHRKDLPGKPDIVFPSRKKVVFVHGCFWHSHSGCKRARVPTDNRDYWEQKLARNRDRDQENQKKLLDLGWSFKIVWECETKDMALTLKRLKRFLGPPGKK